MELRKNFLFQKSLVFSLTFVGFALFHANRKTFSNVKTTIIQVWTPSFHNHTINKTQPDELWNSHTLFANAEDAEYFMGTLDTVFMIAYALGLYISGFIGDRFDLRKIITIGTCGSALSLFLFGTLSEWLHLYSMPYYLVMWTLNGLLQSTGWPCMVAVMSNWFGISSRGMVFGLWSACASVGNIVGSLMAASVLHYGYEYAFLVPSVVMFCWGLIMFMALVISPQEIGLQSPTENIISDVVTDVSKDIIEPDDQSPLLSQHEEAEADVRNSNDSITQDPHGQTQDTAPQTKSSSAIGFGQALCLPGVMPYSIGYAFLKLVNYAFFFWLPFYLTSKYQWSQADADTVSIWYDVGSIIGGTVSGYISDRLGKRAPVLEVMVLLGAPLLVIYSNSPNDRIINSTIMFFMGACLSGASSLLGSAISADLGQQDAIQGNKQALSTVTGIVDGTGSVGAAVGQLFVPLLHNSLGWDSVFYLFMAMALCTFLCILPICVRELRTLNCCQRFSRRTQGHVYTPVLTSHDD